MNDLFLLFAELQQLLEEERAALLGGRPDRIIEVVERKRALADKIDACAALPDATPPTIEVLTRAARYNRDNAVICSAMLRHLMQALDKLRRSEPHRSYRPDGSERNPPARHTLGAA
jgi:flagellar biosynthesis/type III secretory pathway chaperone